MCCLFYRSSSVCSHFNVFFLFWCFCRRADWEWCNWDELRDLSFPKRSFSNQKSGTKSTQDMVGRFTWWTGDGVFHYISPPVTRAVNPSLRHNFHTSSPRPPISLPWWHKQRCNMRENQHEIVSFLSAVAAAPATLTLFVFITRLWINLACPFNTHTKKHCPRGVVAGPVGWSGAVWDDAGMHDTSSSAGPSPPPANLPPSTLPVLHHQRLHLCLLPLWRQAGAGAISGRGVWRWGSICWLWWPEGYTLPAAAYTECLRWSRGRSHRGQDRSCGFGVCGKSVFSTGSGDCGHLGVWPV